MKKIAFMFVVAMMALMAIPHGNSYAAADTMDFQLNAQNNSGQSGTVTITKKSDADITVSITLSNGTSTPQPAHIHKGTCATLDPKPAYPLTNVVNGKSETEVMVSMADLAKGEYAVNIHKSEAEVGTYVACADLKAMMAGGTMTGGTMTGGTTAGGSMTGMEPMNVTLNAQNGSGQTGTATITKKSDADIMVSITLSNGTSTPQPAHIHKGTCANLDPKPAYPLTNVVNGKSDTEVMVNMADLEKGQYAINIHKSEAEVGTYVACGDLQAMMAGGTTGTMTGGTTGTMAGGTMAGGSTMPTTGNGDLPLLLAGLALVGLTLTGAGLRLARNRA